jgi:NADH dehydrogenase [ubiquinone] 1 alpha subcomplex assembly factor 1
MKLLTALLATTALSSSLFEFKAGETNWYVINDGVMGGVSSSTVKIQNGILEFTGQVRLENNGGFASIRSVSGQYNLSNFLSLRLRVRGDGKKYSFQIGTSNTRGILYQFEFGTKAGQWLELDVPLKDMKPTRFGQVLARPAFDSSRIEYFGFIVGNKKAEDFKLELDWIRAG